MKALSVIAFRVSAVFLLTVLFLSNSYSVTNNDGADKLKKKEVYIPEIQESKSGRSWRCETWGGDQYFGWAEDYDWDTAANMSIKYCNDSPGKEKCGTPVCRFTPSHKTYKA